MKEDLQQIAFAKLRSVISGDDSLLYSFRPDAFKVDAAAIILDLNEDVIAAVVGTYGDIAVIRFSRAITLLGRFQPVGNGVANQVDERIGDLLDDVVVEFCLCSGE